MRATWTPCVILFGVMSLQQHCPGERQTRRPESCNRPGRLLQDGETTVSLGGLHERRMTAAGSEQVSSGLGAPLDPGREQRGTPVVGQVRLPRRRPGEAEKLTRLRLRPTRRVAP
jgi:hypothetical protein